MQWYNSKKKMNREYNELSALILAGGKSTRMGRNKALLEHEGTSFIQMLIAQLEGLFIEIIICASAPGDYVRFGHRVAEDEKPGLGPLMGILSGLKASKTHSNFVIACDIPRIDTGFLKRMILFSSGYDIVIPRHPDGKYEPLLGIYKKSALPSIEKQLSTGNSKIALIFPRCCTGFMDMDSESWYKNINTYEDYKEYISQTKRGKKSKAGE